MLKASEARDRVNKQLGIEVKNYDYYEKILEKEIDETIRQNKYCSSITIPEAHVRNIFCKLESLGYGIDSVYAYNNLNTSEDYWQINFSFK